ncbi:MAG: glycosyltransferase family 1 protein [Catenulispora sp.]|nr:glycosyltransferase family 1 protein [Catenulispora sp.]
MRILFTFIGGSGHFQPLIPFARAAQARGHTVAVAGGAARQAEIKAAGFAAFATSEPRPRPAASAEPTLEPVDPQAEERQLRKGFAGTGARRHATRIRDLAQSWHADLIVRDEVDFGSAIAAELLGIPCASVVILPTGGFLRPEIIAEPLEELRAEYGLAPDPQLSWLYQGPLLAPFPPTLRDPAFPLPPTAFHCRSIDAVENGTPTDRPPAVYFSLGTVYGVRELIERVLAGLATTTTKAHVVATVGERFDPASFGPHPDRMRIERFIPQQELLPASDLVISHAGSGTLLGTLAHGLPSLLLPMGADQTHNAKRCEQLGVARVLDPLTATPDAVSAAVDTLLNDRSHRAAADRIRQEFNALAGPEAAVRTFEQA